MDFAAAIAAHSLWKSKLRRYISNPDHSLNPATITKDDECDLGKWIVAESRVHAANPKFNELRREHTRFHALAGDLVRRADAGQKVASEVELSASSEYSKCTTKVVQLLGQLRDRKN